MKNLIYLTIFVCSIIAVFIQSCCSSTLGGCCNITCPKDEKTPEYIEALIPYKVGNLIQFVSNDDDSISFTCTARDYFDELEVDNSGAVQECCGSFKVEGFECEFEREGKTELKIINSNSPFEFIRCTIIYNNDTLIGKWNLDFPNPSSNILLAGQDFQNVVRGNMDSTIFFKADSNVGLVGFKLGGKEWRKL